ncbi:MAG TPA: 16S rRNA (guanine(527)-N(7))-methyltransferase RsmG [Prolixibacteraceae bacterium]|nr:16S rRNA (guanine(527)-N(7))-methyltransferase RsmG [Prolixibacteraceae bacterium]
MNRNSFGRYFKKRTKELALLAVETYTYLTVDVILKYFPALQNSQIEQFKKIEGLYAEWNSKINVISRQDINELYLRHVLHSLAIAKLVRFTNGTKIIDVGCGGGFPGIPLAIMFPETHFTLVDSIGKKIKVVNEIANALGLKNITALHERAENLPEKFDFIVSRAVTAFPDFVKMTRKLISEKHRNAIPNGIIYLKGGDFSEEIASFKKTIEITEIPTYFDEPFFETKKIIYLPL